MPWRPIPLSYAIAVYPFVPATSTAELPLQIGDQIYIIEEGGKNFAWCRGYLIQPPSLLGALSSNTKTASDTRVFSGIFPKCCVAIREQLGQDGGHKELQSTARTSKPQAPVPLLKAGDESPTSAAEPLIDEISSCLREWYATHLPDLILRQDYPKLGSIEALVTNLDYARRELLNDVLTDGERAGVRNEAIWHMIRGNKLLDAEIIVRDPASKGRIRTAEDSTVELSKLQAVMSLLDDAVITKKEIPRLHHILLRIRPSSAKDAELLKLSIAVYAKGVDGKLSQLSENFACSATHDTQTLFTEISARELVAPSKIYIVATVATSEPARTESTLQHPPRRSTFLPLEQGATPDKHRSNLAFGSIRKPSRAVNQMNGRPLSSRAEVKPSITSDDPDKKATSTPLVRNVAVGIVDATMLLQQGQVAELSLDLWRPTQDDTESKNNTTLLLSELLQLPTTSFTPFSKLASIPVRVVPYTAGSTNELLKANPTVLHQVVQTQRMGFAQASSVKRSELYLTILNTTIMHARNLSHPEHGIVPLKPAPFLNLQTTMEVRNGKGERIERCIYASSSSKPVTAIRTSATEIGTLWNQTFCIRLPAEKLIDAHLILSIADAPGFPFALAWMPLSRKTTILSDGDHYLMLHAYDKSTSSFSDSGRGAYLNLPWEHPVPKRSSEVSVASLLVSTRLVSTELSQDPVLTDLLRWRNLLSDNLAETLAKLVFVAEIEIVKQLNEVLDTLFAILEYKAGMFRIEDQIFNNIVFVLGIAHDPRFNLGPRLVEYANNHFKAPIVAPSLVRSLTRLLQSVSDPQSARDMRAFFKVGRQFMRLLMLSYSQYTSVAISAEISEKISGFKQNMKAVFFGLQMMLRSESPALIGSKTILVQNFHEWLPEILAVYSTAEVIEIAIEMVDSCNEATGKLALHRLVMILNFTTVDQLWSADADWTRLSQECLRWILEPPSDDKLAEGLWADRVRLSSSILAELLKRPTDVLHEALPYVLSSYIKIANIPQSKHKSLTLLFPSAYPFVSRAISTQDNYSEALIELSALLTEIMKLRSGLPQVSSVDDKIDQINQALSIVHHILAEAACPSSWLSLHVVFHTAALSLLTSVADELNAHFLPEVDDAEVFDTELWKSYFLSLLALVASPALTLEAFPEQKRRAVWTIVGDVRQEGANLLRKSWTALGWEAEEEDARRYNLTRLGGFQVQYVPSLVANVTELCLSMHEGLRKIGVEILQTMIISEWSLNEDLALIETDIISALNTILRARAASTTSLSGNEIVARKLFINELLESFATIANQPDDALWVTLEELVATIEELIDLLSGVTNPEMLEEASVTQRQSNTSTSAVAPQRGQRSMDISERSISRLEGKVHGAQALEAYKQLADEYERTGDHARLARTHRAIARIHEQRATSRMGSRADRYEDLEEEDE